MCTDVSPITRPITTFGDVKVPGLSCIIVAAVLPDSDISVDVWSAFTWDEHYEPYNPGAICRKDSCIPSACMRLKFVEEIVQQNVGLSKIKKTNRT